jgi:hypothetical protein
METARQPAGENMSLTKEQIEQWRYAWTAPYDKRLENEFIDEINALCDLALSALKDGYVSVPSVDDASRKLLEDCRDVLLDDRYYHPKELLDRIDAALTERRPRKIIAARGCHYTNEAWEVCNKCGQRHCERFYNRRGQYAPYSYPDKERRTTPDRRKEGR